MKMISMIMNFMFLYSNNPLTLGLMLLLQTINLIIMIGMMNFTFWFSYIIFLIFIGGMLILFMYVISLINMKFNNYKMFNKYIMFIYLFIIMMMMNLNMNFMNNMETKNINKFMFLNENLTNLIKMYNFPNLMINILLINYLFIMMIISTKITNYMMGPFFKY